MANKDNLFTYHLFVFTVTKEVESQMQWTKCSLYLQNKLNFDYLGFFYVVWVGKTDIFIHVILKETNFAQWIILLWGINWLFPDIFLTLNSVLISSGQSFCGNDYWYPGDSSIVDGVKLKNIYIYAYKMFGISVYLETFLLSIFQVRLNLQANLF